ncbi:MAG: DUF2817 domain-containing protein [Gammaproteobacteria bacterium]|uniref:M14 family zinc carboxypeptidase n=1 Tax=Pseudomaricurvus alcaniphilus TaxID=1166482 RepID=UPI00140D5EB0|nr:M14 family zinc carboxypeptidase [Pseudomaricurvus alcaniphilus]MBR9911662.1 DUF2817 domain-containing protein [Gammaproteobacteria bacterium]NHN39393.1 DUF2817 domain-containing protein [Pseudomaricurvus alcaniphilus]
MGHEPHTSDDGFERLPFPEYARLEALVAAATPYARLQTLGEVSHGHHRYPLQALVFGSDDRTLPCVGFFAGVHGLEKIGTHLALAYLSAFVGRLQWDQYLRNLLQHCRLVTVPLVNPLGMLMRRRSNANGVDLMRNAPVEAEHNRHWPISGQRLSTRIPWYRGRKNAPMQLEARAIADFVQTEMFPSRYGLTLDLHSGFGATDRLWYPYARTVQPFPYLDQARLLAQRLRITHPYHVYQVEAQSDSYLAHGDLWDYLVDLHVAANPEGERVLLPWTLEMGSWLWVRKNPLQLFDLLGPFNPIRPHRYRRTLRRHWNLLEFFLHAAANHDRWGN